MKPYLYDVPNLLIAHGANGRSTACHSDYSHSYIVPASLHLCQFSRRLTRPTHYLHYPSQHSSRLFLLLTLFHSYPRLFFLTVRHLRSRHSYFVSLYTRPAFLPLHSNHVYRLPACPHLFCCLFTNKWRSRRPPSPMAHPSRYPVPASGTVPPSSKSASAERNIL